MSKPPVKPGARSSGTTSAKHDPNNVGTTGHVWDGIEEMNNPLPRWWVWTLYATIVWAVAYTIAYPAWPMVTRATSGLLGYSTRDAVATEIAAMNAKNADLMVQLASADLTTLDPTSQLYSFAVNGGGAVFRANCSQCHGSGAAGLQSGGYPNLLDNDWLWGGTVTDIAYSITHGIRNEQSADSRFNIMQAYGDDPTTPEDDPTLTPEEIDAVVNHVLAISGQDHDAAMAATGAIVFSENCVGCHGENGEGNRDLGAPMLTDAIWLYGGDEATLHETLNYGRAGAMPAWAEEYRPGGGGLTQAEINAVATYVHQLGGGE